MSPTGKYASLNIEAKVERALTSIDALSDRLTEHSDRDRADLDEIKMLISTSRKEAHDTEARVKIEKHSDAIQALQFWRWMLIGAWSVLTVVGGIVAYISTHVIIEEIHASIERSLVHK